MREQILATIVSTLQPFEFILALQEGGSAAHGQTDRWSDLDVQMVVQDDRIEETFEVVESALTKVAPIKWQCRLPEPTWHGHSQCFYQLEGTSPFLAIDLVVMKLSNPDRFLEVERHGNLVVHFDKAHLLEPIALDQPQLFAKIAERVTWLKQMFEFQQMLVRKSINRGCWIEGIASYHAWTLQPLIELLNIVYRPNRYDFRVKYFSRDLPPDIVARVESLYRVADLSQLIEKQQLAEAFFAETLPRAEAIVDRQS